MRRSPFSTTPRFDVAMETLCTMRHWKEATATTNASYHSPSHQEGPELVLSAVHDYLDNRDVTPVRQRRPRQISPSAATTPSAAYSIPLADIVVIERGVRRCKFTVTTVHQGLFEFDLRNDNRHDLLLAFLAAHLPAERIQFASDGSVSLHSTCSSKSQMDVDRLQDKTMQETVETWPARLSRRMSKVATSIQQLSGTVCDLTACCRDVVNSADHHIPTSPATHDLRDEAPRVEPAASYAMPVANGGHLEMDEEVSTMTRKDSALSSSYYARGGVPVYR